MNCCKRNLKAHLFLDFDGSHKRAIDFQGFSEPLRTGWCFISQMPSVWRPGCSELTGLCRNDFLKQVKGAGRDPGSLRWWAVLARSKCKLLSGKYLLSAMVCPHCAKQFANITFDVTSLVKWEWLWGIWVNNSSKFSYLDSKRTYTRLSPSPCS